LSDVTVLSGTCEITDKDQPTEDNENRYEDSDTRQRSGQVCGEATQQPNQGKSPGARKKLLIVTCVFALQPYQQSDAECSTETRE